MNKTVLFTICICFLLIKGSAADCKGCLQLDENNFEKIVPRFKAVLVKFDVAYPYGEKHDTFGKLAVELVGQKELLLANIGVKDYGEKENEQLANRYGIRKEDFPAVGLFLGSTENPIPFPKDTEWTLDNLRNFIRDNTKLYIGLPGCLEAFDKIAAGFTSGKQDDLIKKAQKLLENLNDEEKASGEIYIKYMKKIKENGAEFVSNEQKRISKILKESKLNEKKKQELSERLNILRSFDLPKDEL